ncbi:MAG: hypothetical protein JST58_17585 [Bacteroidetes bacterium]|nr:hypothetical protein [Bacteroidota bacterium]
MKLRYLLLAILVTAIACTKSGGGKPQIKLKSIGPDVISRSDLFSIDLGFTNLTGNGNDTLIVIKHVLNLNQRGSVNEFQADSFAIPNFTSSNNAGDLQLTFARQLINGYAYLADPATAQNDTAIFNFVAKVFPNITSDTVKSGKIVILSQ